MVEVRGAHHLAQVGGVVESDHAGDGDKQTEVDHLSGQPAVTGKAVHDPAPRQRAGLVKQVETVRMGLPVVNHYRQSKVAGQAELIGKGPALHLRRRILFDVIEPDFAVGHHRRPGGQGGDPIESVDRCLPGVMRVEADGGVNAGVVVGDGHRPARACFVDTNGDNAPHPVFRGRLDHRVQIGGEGFHVEVAVGVDQFGAGRQGRQCLLGGLHLDLPGDQGDVATVYRYRHGTVPNRSGPTRPDVHRDAWQRCLAGRMLADITTLFFYNMLVSPLPGAPTGPGGWEVL